MSDDDFERRAHAALANLLAQLDAQDLDLEAEFAIGILTIEFPDGSKYVINSHRAAKQIWMAAERAAWHFDERDGGWIATKSGEALHEAISTAVGRKLGRSVPLSAPA